MNRRSLACACAVGGMLWTLSDASADAPEITWIETAALEARRSITSGELTIQGAGADGGRSHLIMLDAAFEGDNIKIVEHVPSPSGDEESTWAQCRNDVYYLSYNSQRHGAAQNMLSVYDLGPSLEPYAAVTDFPDPRLLGMAPLNYHMLKHFHLESFVGSPLREASAEVRDVQYDGTACQFVEYVRDSDFNHIVRIWIAPSYGNSVVKIEQEFVSNGVSFLDSVQVDVSPHNSGRAWFPTKVQYRRTEGGRQTGWENLDVEVHSLNERLGDDYFSVAAMDVPERTLIARFPSDPRGQLMWNGSEMVVVSDADVKDIVFAETDESDRVAKATALVLTSIACLVLAIAILYKRYRAS